MAQFSDMDVRPFEVRVTEEVLDDLRERLARTRWPDEVAGAGWEYGTSLAYMQELVEYWEGSFDWREQEQRLNRSPTSAPSSTASASISCTSAARDLSPCH